MMQSQTSVTPTRQTTLREQLKIVTGSAKTKHNSAIQIFQYEALKHIG